MRLMNPELEATEIDRAIKILKKQRDGSLDSEFASRAKEAEIDVRLFSYAGVIVEGFSNLSRINLAARRLRKLILQKYYGKHPDSLSRIPLSPEQRRQVEDKIFKLCRKVSAYGKKYSHPKSPSA